MNGRYYDGQEVICEYWDGTTDYKRSGLEDLLRLEQFGSLLEEKLEKIEEHENENENSEDESTEKKE